MSDTTAIDFDEAWYLTTYDDIRQAIEKGGFKTGLEHYTKFGAAEGRLPRAPSTLSNGEAYEALRAARSEGSLLDTLGIRHGTHKSSLGRGYLRTYERLFAPFRDLPITVLEIGVLDGASLRLWEDYFPRAIIVGLDIQPDCKQHEGGRRLVEIVSQADTAALRQIGARYTPTIIIDDGSHRADHIRASFETLYPALREGGLYIVEALEAHTGNSAALYRAGADTSPQAWFLNLANLVACPNEDLDFGRAIAGMTESVEFLGNAVAVRRRG